MANKLLFKQTEKECKIKTNISNPTRINPRKHLWHSKKGRHLMMQKTSE